ncbi:MAG: NADH-quinone oxidoreductase subunit NuoH [Bacteroidetes bacterium]|jgi:NADH-quinone oxidoreductase subunit H|nr:NADH-quinone oxidoreductase subunit NuoH [Bacteroidota bacterium]
MAEVTITSYIILGSALFMLLNSAAITVYAERRVAAFIQNRVGPNRVGPLGLFQPLADVVKLLLKEDVTPNNSYRILHTVAPIIPVVTALMTVAVIPFGDGIYATDINAGVLYLLAVASLGVYGVTLAGWASNSKYSLLGGLRAAAQMISYELPLGMAVASVVIFVGSLSVVDIAAAQENWWFVMLNPVGAIIFIVAAFAESNRTPFDLVEAEQELVGGFHTEYSSMKFGMFFLAEYMHVVINSMLMTTFFFGSYHLPFAGYWLPELPAVAKTILDISVFSAKTVFFVFLFIWVRWTIPRFKFNQVMKLGWSKLLPLSIANFIVIAGILFLIYG